MCILIDLGISLIKGFLLGGSVYLIGTIMDNTISKDSKKKLIETKEKVYNKGEELIRENLLIISPIVYGVVDTMWLTHELNITLYHFFGLLLIQNIGYFFVHKEMHRNKRLYWMHRFHHNFDELTIPSTGNAVSKIEFCLAYICPIVTGAIILKPTELTFLSSIGTISIFNLIIHTNELDNYWWIPGFVSPTDHIEHHKVRTKNYAAPLLNIDDFILVTDSMWKQYKEIPQ